MAWISADMSATDIQAHKYIGLGFITFPVAFIQRVYSLSLGAASVGTVLFTYDRSKTGVNARIAAMWDKALTTARFEAIIIGF